MKVKVIASVKQLEKLGIPLEHALDFITVVAHEASAIECAYSVKLSDESDSWWISREFIKEL